MYTNIMSIDYNKCAYINPEKQNATVMMKPCINGVDSLVWPCIEKEMIDKDIFSFATERPQADNIQQNLPHSLNNKISGQKKDNLQVINSSDTVEGFTNMGESYVRPGDCPDGYNRCPLSGKCIQVCMNCKYNQRTYAIGINNIIRMNKNNTNK